MGGGIIQPCQTTVKNVVRNILEVVGDERKPLTTEQLNLVCIRLKIIPNTKSRRMVKKKWEKYGDGFSQKRNPCIETRTK